MSNNNIGGVIRIFVVDDHPMVRAGLAGMIGAEDDFELVGEAADGLAALQLAPRVEPDIVLMDLVMPRLDGIKTILQLRTLLTHARIIVLTSLLDPIEVRRAIDAGAAGYILKNASSQELVTAIRAVHGGRRVLAPDATDALVAASQHPAPGGDLTQREREILALMTRGHANQEIAQKLGIALPTVKFHVTNILSKLHCENRTEAVLAALKHRLVDGN